MRNYPRKCIYCKQYMEPVFDKGADFNRGMNTYMESNKYQEPTSWKCINVDCKKAKKRGEK